MFTSCGGRRDSASRPRRLAAAMLCAAAVLALSACADEPEDEADDSDGGAVDVEPVTVGLGGPVALVADEFEATYALQALEPVEFDLQGEPAPDGEVYVVALFEVVCYQGVHRAGVANPDLRFALRDAAGDEHERAETDASPPLEEEVEADDRVDGAVTFAVPDDALDGVSVVLHAEGLTAGDLEIVWEQEG